MADAHRLVIREVDQQASGNLLGAPGFGPAPILARARPTALPPTNAARRRDDTGKSVAQAVKEAEGKVGGAIKIAGFVRYALGEGIEKQESDFAAEVAAASGKK